MTNSFKTAFINNKPVKLIKINGQLWWNSEVSYLDYTSETISKFTNIGPELWYLTSFNAEIETDIKVQSIITTDNKEYIHFNNFETLEGKIIIPIYVDGLITKQNITDEIEPNLLREIIKIQIIDQNGLIYPVQNLQTNFKGFDSRLCFESIELLQRTSSTLIEEIYTLNIGNLNEPNTFTLYFEGNITNSMVIFDNNISIEYDSINNETKVNIINPGYYESFNGLTSGSTILNINSEVDTNQTIFKKECKIIIAFES